MYNMGMCFDKPFLLFRFPDNHETKVLSDSAAATVVFFFYVCAFSQTVDIRRNVSQKFTEPSMEPQYWCKII